MNLSLYGSWNGSHVVAMEDATLVHINEGKNNITLQKAKLKKDDFNGNFTSFFKETITKYEDNVQYRTILQLSRHGEKIEFECHRNEKQKEVLDTSLWRCGSSHSAKQIPLISVCNGYRDTEQDCNDTTTFTDESKELCSVDAPLSWLATLLCYFILGFISFLTEIIIWKYRSSTTKKDSKPKNDTSLGLENGAASPAKKLLSLCKSTNGIKNWQIKHKSDAVNKIVADVYKPCSDGDGKKTLFQLLYTLSLYAKFRVTVESIVTRIISIEKTIHKDKKCQYIHCLRQWYGKSSYLSGFLKQVIEKDELPSRLKRGIVNCFTFKSNLINLRINIAWNITVAFASLAFYYYDHLKDLVVLNLLFHIDKEILRDTDPKLKFTSVGGVNFQVMAVYLLAIFFISELIIYVYAFKQKGAFQQAFKIDVTKSWMWWLVVVFPIHYIILTSCMVKVLVNLLEYKLAKIIDKETSTEEEENDAAKSIQEISQELDSLIGQSYYLNNVHSEIELVESAFERCPQAIIQLSLLILMTQFKRLGILFDSSLGMDLTTFLIITWVIPIITIVKCTLRYIHRKRYPITPGGLGQAIQFISVACLVVPKLMVISFALLNSVQLHPLLFCAELVFVVVVHKCMLNENIKGFDALMMAIVPTYFKHHQDSDDECPEHLPKRTLRGVVAWIIHGFSMILCLVVGWGLRKTLFFFNVDRDAVEGEFLEDFALEQGFFTNGWLILTAIYFGGSIVAFLLNALYFKIGHPWKMARDKSC